MKDTILFNFGAVRFGQTAAHYKKHVLGDQTEAVDPKSHTTIAGYNPIWTNTSCRDGGALSLEPREIETWLKQMKQEKKMANPTLDRLRRIMSLAYRSGQRYGLIPRSEHCNPLRFVRCRTASDYEAVTIASRAGV